MYPWSPGSAGGVVPPDSPSPPPLMHYLTLKVSCPCPLDLVPYGLVDDPQRWSKEDVRLWLGFCSEEFAITTLRPDHFDMNGKALCLLTREDFLERDRNSGDVLYNALQLLLRTRTGSLTTASPNGAELPSVTAASGVCESPGDPTLRNRLDIINASVAGGMNTRHDSFVPQPMDLTPPPAETDKTSYSSAPAPTAGSSSVTVEECNELFPSSVPVDYSMSSVLRESPPEWTGPVVSGPEISGPDSQSATESLPTTIDDPDNVATPDAVVESVAGSPCNESELTGEEESGEEEGGGGGDDVASDTHNQHDGHDAVDSSSNHHSAISSSTTSSAEPVNSKETSDLDRKNGSGGECRLLWEFIYQLLEDQSKDSRRFVSWDVSSSSSQNLIFRIVNPAGLAELWGQQKNRSNMTYEKLSRALRYYYKMNIITKVPGKRLTYMFLQHPVKIQKGQRGAKPRHARNLSSNPSQRISPNPPASSPNNVPQSSAPNTHCMSPQDSQPCTAPSHDTDDTVSDATPVSSSGPFIPNGSSHHSALLKEFCRTSVNGSKSPLTTTYQQEDSVGKDHPHIRQMLAAKMRTKIEPGSALGEFQPSRKQELINLRHCSLSGGLGSDHGVGIMKMEEHYPEEPEDLSLKSSPQNKRSSSRGEDPSLRRPSLWPSSPQTSAQRSSRCLTPPLHPHSFHPYHPHSRAHPFSTSVPCTSILFGNGYISMNGTDHHQMPTESSYAGSSVVPAQSSTVAECGLPVMCKSSVAAEKTDYVPAAVKSPVGQGLNH